MGYRKPCNLDSMPPKLKAPKRVNFYLPEELIKAIKYTAYTEEIAMSEIGRVAIWEWLERHAPEGPAIVMKDWDKWKALWRERMNSLMTEFEEQVERNAVHHWLGQEKRKKQNKKADEQ